MTTDFSPSSHEPETPESRTKPKRPSLIAIGVVVAAFRLGRDEWGSFLGSRYGILGWVLAWGSIAAVLITWRIVSRRRAGPGEEYSTDQVRRQIADSGLPGPAFPEDGTLTGASVLAVNQKPKLLEVITEYLVFDSGGEPLGSVRQIAQGRFRRLMRILTAFDQFFTHHLEVYDRDGQVRLRVTRPRKIFKSRLHVFDGENNYLGRIRQENVFFKIRFTIEDAAGNPIGRILAENWRAWDFRIEDLAHREVARIVKTWEGMARAVFTQADLYVARLHEPLDEPLRTMVLAGVLTIDLALKQDPQGLNG